MYKRQVARSAAKSLVAGLLTGLAAFGAAWAVAELTARMAALQGTMGWLLVVLAGGVAGVLAYTAAVFALDISETRALPRLLRR